MNIVNRISYSLVTLILLLQTTAAQSFERRRDQDRISSSYLFLPLPYSYPGIGEGIMGLVQAGDVAGTPIDFTAIQIFGDVNGTIAQLAEVPLIPNMLFYGGTYQKFSKISFSNYNKRGLDSEKEDYSLIEINKGGGMSSDLTLSLWDKRIEMKAGIEKFNFEAVALRNPEGEIIAEFDEPLKSEDNEKRISIKLDFTDDYDDARKGLRTEISATDDLKNDNETPDYYVVNTNTSLFFPVGKSNTLIFNHSSSDAVMEQAGNVNEAEIAESIGIQCADDDSACLESRQSLIDDKLAENGKGTANSIGGNQRMRSYPGGRFKAAHTRVVGSEFRWNFLEGARPFDFGIWKDVAATYQLAAFYEVGSAEENESDLWSETRDSYGVGFRMVSQSGSVYRADIAQGEEGSEFTMFFDYPW
jgi:hypothetical protein